MTAKDSSATHYDTGVLDIDGFYHVPAENKGRHRLDKQRLSQ